jgi:hypothetical protein
MYIALISALLFCYAKFSSELARIEANRFDAYRQTGQGDEWASAHAVAARARLRKSAEG